MLLASVVVHRFVDNQWLVSNCILLRIMPRSMEFRIIMKDYPSFLLTRCNWCLCYVWSQTSSRRQVEVSSGSYILRHAKTENNCIFLGSRNLSLDGLLSAQICPLCVLSSSLYSPADISFSLPLTFTAFLIFFPPAFLYSNWFFSHGFTLFQPFLHANQFSFFPPSFLSFKIPSFICFNSPPFLVPCCSFTSKSWRPSSLRRPISPCHDRYTILYQV